MPTKPRPLVVGNWKMNGTSASLIELRAIAAGLSSDLGTHFDTVICLPATLLSRANDSLNGQDNIFLGGEDCHERDEGAHTGDISASMLKDAGASYVIVGHSERRRDHCENDLLVNEKVKAAWRADLKVILCVGETLQQYENGQTLDVIFQQLTGSLPEGFNADNTIVAYEPVWAVGTGHVPTEQDITKVYNHMRQVLIERSSEQGKHLPFLYGGSVHSTNVAQLLNVCHVGGFLVGGASLNAVDFLAICDAYRKK